MAKQLEQYRTLVNEKLLPLADQREQTHKQLTKDREEWRELSAQLELFACANKHVKLKTDLGEGFLMTAKVEPHGLKVSIDVGAGVFVEMTLDEARTFCSAKVEMLDQAVRDARDSLVAVRADITTAKAALLALGGDDHKRR
jgi:prefoldin subunit 5